MNIFKISQQESPRNSGRTTMETRKRLCFQKEALESSTPIVWLDIGEEQGQWSGGGGNHIAQEWAKC